MTLGDRVQRAVASCAIAASFMAAVLAAQDSPHERVFPQTKAAVERALHALQPTMSGHLPTLEGFANAGDRPLERYQRGYYQTTVLVTAMADGSSLARATSKVTAWYSDPAGFHSGYELLTSNGRIEEDLLDQLADQLSRVAGGQVEQAAPAAAPKLLPATPATAPSVSRPADDSSRANSVSGSGSSSKPVAAPTPSTGSDISAPSAVSRAGEFSASSDRSLGSAERASAHDSTTPTQPGPRQPTEKAKSALQAEADSLEEILRNQAHPNNLVAVKKSGIPVVSSPSITAKPLFLASLHDEFELLDFNRDWVHVRISGLSRGWIWRDSVEMPNGIPDTVVQKGPAPPAAADLFRVVREETAPFPGDWEPLRGKTVKIFSVQKADENAKDTGPAERLAYAKFLLDKTYVEITQRAGAQKPQELTGIVLIFDSADGGMIAATMVALQQWKAGVLSDSALWHKCFFDPPETFDSTGSSGSQ